ncbi:MAG: glycosyltransferase family 4 protein [Anaerolineae bacterium]|nr:glycosyltransferase family 4 protein [Anaerolineae bacterium]
MKVLVLSGWFPYPPDNGSKIRAFNLIRQMASRHEITLISFSDDLPGHSERKAFLRPYCRQVHIVPSIHFNPHRWRAILGALSLTPRFVIDTFSVEMQQAIEHLTKENDFDVLIALEGTAFYAKDIKGPLKVVDDLQLASWRDAFSGQLGLMARLRYGPAWWKFKRMVRQFVDAFDAYVVVSDREREHIEAVVPLALSKPSAVIPNGVDWGSYVGDFGAPRPESLVFSGALTFFANLWAMEFFLRDIHPLIKRKRPGVVLRITGKTTGVPLEKLPKRDGVIFTGYLDDIRPCIAQSWVSVVPLNIGGGTRLKILEAMALGTPVVSTSKGAEGLEVTPGEDILIADEPTEFADAVLRLLDDQALRAKLAAHGRRLVKERYSWETCAQKLEQLLCQVVEQRKGIE